MPVRWRKLENFKLELPRDTLLSVEIVQELKGEVRGWAKQMKKRGNGAFLIDLISVIAEMTISVFDLRHCCFVGIKLHYNIVLAPRVV